MPIEITMPRLSDTMEEGTLVKWRVAVGEQVASGDHLADVETDKATMELQAFDDGKVAQIAIDEGKTVPVGALIMVLAEEGESVEDAVSAAGNGEAAPAEKSSEPEAEKAQDAEPPASPPKGSGGSVRISPLARKLADEHGVDIAQIQGSGPDGRIIKRDILAAAEGKGRAAPASPAPAAAPVQAAAPSAPAAPIPTTLEAKTIELSGMRKTIAKRLVESKTTIPHFQVSMSIDMDPLLELRKTLNAQLESQGVKLSVNDFIVRATALAAVQHPVVNSSWNVDSIVQHGTVNVGVAIALPAERGGGLVVAVLKDAQSKGLRQISADTKTLAKKARESGLSADDMADGTVTISNLGMYGVDHFTAIVNPPQAAILAIGGAIEKPVVRDGELAIGHEMTITLSGDHRVLDGATGAEYLLTLRQMLENPAGLLV